jgi:hypothetical protein
MMHGPPIHQLNGTQERNINENDAVDLATLYKDATLPPPPSVVLNARTATWKHFALRGLSRVTPIDRVSIPIGSVPAPYPAATVSLP